MDGSRGGPGGHSPPPPPPPPPHSTTILHKCRSIRISFRLAGLRSVKMANSFWGGGEGREGAVRGSQNFGGSSAIYIINYQRQSKILILSYFVTPPPRVSGSAPETKCTSGTRGLLRLVVTRKMWQLRSGNTWFLRSDWWKEDDSSSLKGTDWLNLLIIQ